MQSQSRFGVKRLSRGLVQVYTGNGKGKTTAALGVVLRAAGYGLRSHIVFFMKGRARVGELQSLSRLSTVTFEHYGLARLVTRDNVGPKDRTAAAKGLADARSAMLSGEYDIVVLDEINVASAWQLVDVDSILELIEEKPEKVELILTGRYADDRLVQAADLVTEMVARKHPYDLGLQSRAGIDF